MKQITVPTYLIYGLLIAILLISGIFFFAMKDGNACINNSFIYGVKKATSEETGHVTCSCDFSNPEYATLYFDIDGMSTKNLLYDNLLG